MPKPDNNHPSQLSVLLRQAEPPQSPRHLDEGIQNLAREQASLNRAAFKESEKISWFSQPLARAAVAFSMAGIALSIALQQDPEERLTLESELGESTAALSAPQLRTESFSIAPNDSLARAPEQQSSVAAQELAVANDRSASAVAVSAAPIEEPQRASRRAVLPATAAATIQQSAAAVLADATAVNSLEATDEYNEDIRLLALLERFFALETAVLPEDAGVPESLLDAAAATANVMADDAGTASQRRQALLERYDLATEKPALQERFQQEADLRQEYSDLGLPQALSQVIEQLRMTTFSER